jgi:hypothetical protein
MLFKDTRKLKEFAEITGDVMLAEIRPTLLSVELDQLAPLMSDDLYRKLDQAYNDAANEDALSDALKELLEHCRRFIGPAFCAAWAPKTDVKLGTSGMQRTETEGYKSAYQYQGAKFVKAMIGQADLAAEALLRFIEKYAGEFPEWEESPAQKRRNALFIKSGLEFNEYFPSASPFRNYLALSAKMMDVELLQVKKKISAPLYNYLKEKAKEGEEFTDDESDLLVMIKKAIANLTVSFALPLLAVQIDEKGLTITSASFGTDDDKNLRDKPTKENMNRLIAATASTGKQWLAEALGLIAEKPESFPLYDQPIQIQRVDMNENLLGFYGIN